VPTIAGTESTTPTATHVSATGQETLDKESRFTGDGWAVQVDPLRVPTIPKPPTAVHWSLVKHEIDCAGNVESWTIHVEPPFVDFRIPVPPPA
jgi:hypothetical protein